MHTRSKCLLPFIYYKSLAALICSLDLYKNVIHKAGVKQVLALRIILYFSGVRVYRGHTDTPRKSCEVQGGKNRKLFVGRL